MNSRTTDRERKVFTLIEVARLTGVDHHTLVVFIQREWISPLTADSLDEEDVARIHLIEELRTDFEANEAAIPLILHLLDQVYHLRKQIENSTKIGTRKPI